MRVCRMVTMAEAWCSRSSDSLYLDRMATKCAVLCSDVLRADCRLAARLSADCRSAFDDERGCEGTSVGRETNHCGIARTSALRCLAFLALSTIPDPKTSPPPLSLRHTHLQPISCVALRCVALRCDAMRCNMLRCVAYPEFPVRLLQL